MKSTSRFALLRLVLSLNLLFLLTAAFAQVQTPRFNTAITPNIGGFYEYLPQGYSPWGGETYPLIVFVHGMGELGSGNEWELPRLLGHALPQRIAWGQFPTSFTVNGQTHKFIVISPQFRNWPSPGDIDATISYAIQNYKVNPSRIYVTGLSMGGGATWEYAGYSSAYANRVAAIVPICGASWPEQSRARTIASANVAVWATHNDGDATVPLYYTDNYISAINQAPAPNPMARKSIFSSGSHDAWSWTYNPAFRENGLNIYEWMLQYSRGGGGSNPVPLPTPSSPIPGKVEAEGYSSANGIQTENTADAGGGQNVGYIDNGDWMEYSVNVTSAGTYGVSFRIASHSNGAQLQLRNSSGTALATVNVPNTGGWQTWQTVTANVTLPAGLQNLRIVSTASAGWNINWMDFGAAAAVPLPTNYQVLPSKVEAENFANQSGTQTEGTSDAGGGQNVGWIDNGDWMDYNVNAASGGSYTLSFRVATSMNGGQLQVRNSSGAALATVAIPQTGGWQTWQTVTANVTLPAGNQTLRVISTASSSWNINWVDFAAGSVVNPAPAPTPGTTNRIEAEHFTNQSGTQTEGTSDAGGGQNVGWIDNGDWMDYNVNAATSGNYTISLRVASQMSGGQLQVRNSSGTALATVTVPNTGGWQTWQTVTANVTLPAGGQTLRIISTASASWNINWFELASGSSSGSNNRIEAESYTGQHGIGTETTSDAGGGQNVGWIDQHDWMDYSVNVASGGTYTFNFRVASSMANAQLQVRSSNGSVLATVNVPNTGGWQTWQTISASVNLQAGTQTIRLQSSSSGSWNINWFEIGGSAAGVIAQETIQTTVLGAAKTDETTFEETSASSLSLYPNPVSDRVVVQLNNNLQGAVRIDIINLQGAVVKTFAMQKTTTGTQQFYLSVGDLPAGNYIVRTVMAEETKSTQMIKQ